MLSFGTDDQRQIYTLDSNGHRIAVYDDSDNNSDTGYTFTINGKEVSGIDSVESYTLDSLGREIQTEKDLGADGNVDSISYSVRNANGYTINYYRNSDMDTATGQSYTLEDGREIVGIDLAEKSIRTPTGYIYELYRDNDGDGVYNFHNYDVRNNLNHLTTIYKDNDNNPETGKSVKLGDRVMEGIEAVEYYENNTAGTLLIAKFDRNFNDSVDFIRYFIRDDSEQLIMFGEGSGEGVTKISRLIFSDLGLKDYSFTKALTFIQNEDFTLWDSERLALFDKSLNRIDLGDTSAKTTITLDSTVLGKIAKTQVKIYGDDNDTVNLKTASNFTKLADTKTDGGEVYDQYTTVVDNTTYTLLIDSDTTVNFV